MVISGRKLARQIRQEARHEVAQWVAAGNKRPHLSVVLVGENPASHSYVLNKTKAAADVGMSCCVSFSWLSVCVRSAVLTATGRRLKQLWLGPLCVS